MFRRLLEFTLLALSTIGLNATDNINQVIGNDCESFLTNINSCNNNIECLFENTSKITEDCASTVCPQLPSNMINSLINPYCDVYCSISDSCKTENSLQTGNSLQTVDFCSNLQELDCRKNYDKCNWTGPLGGCMNRWLSDKTIVEDIICDNLNHQECLRYPKECIYIGCSYGCPGCVNRGGPWDIVEELFETDDMLGNIQYSIQHATSDYWGHDTSAGPDGGVEACAWAVNNIMSMSGLRKIGDNPNYVPSVVDALKAGRGRQIQASQAVPGDLVVACGEQHIGVCMEANCNTIDSNSSSRRCFCWRSGFNFDNYFGCGSATYWRVEN